jgi:hypothetical protein
MLQAGMSGVRVPMRWIFFNLLNSSSRTMALGSTQPIREMSTMNLPGGKERPARKPDDLTAICEPTVLGECGILYVSQPYGPSQPVTGIALLFFLLTLNATTQTCMYSTVYSETKRDKKRRASKACLLQLVVLY